MKAFFEKMIWENQAQTIASFYFRPESSLDYLPGQYVELHVPHDDADGRGVTRTMTLTSSPDDGFMSFATRLDHASGSSFKKALLALKKEDAITIFDAMGDLVLPKDPSTPLVFVAGGVGIASYVSIMKWLTEHNEKRNITILYAVKTTSDVVLQASFDAYAARYPLTCILYTPDVNRIHAWRGEQKKDRLTAAGVAEHITRDSLIYISGAEKMVEQLRSELILDFGVRKDKIVFDFFDGYADL